MGLVHWRRARRVAQAIALLLTLALIVAPTRAEFLLRVDPLAGLSSMLASRTVLTRLLPGLALLALALVLGRSWCGWLCPLGTLIDWTGRKPKEPPLPDGWRKLKYGLVLLTLFAALWGNLTLLIFDPLTILVRGVSAAAIPAVNWVIVRVETGLVPFPWAYRPLAALDGALQGTLLSFKQPHYGGALALAAALAGPLALNLLAPRAWCRYVCPLGALYGLLARHSWVKRRVSEACIRCGRCSRQCPMATVDADRQYASDPSECTLCLDCGADCPVQAIRFAGHRRPRTAARYDPDRRLALGALGASLGGLALLKVAPRRHHPPRHLLRPPGAQEEALLATCLRCGACVRICPSHGLQPALDEAGLEGLWTPILVPRLGACEYACNRCGQVCPSAAIPRLPLDVKRTTPIGKALIDPVLCNAWSGRVPCIVCEEMCPVPHKAIVLEERTVRTTDGSAVVFQVPVVTYERCIGCGLCESKCPIQGESAIRVVVDPLAR